MPFSISRLLSYRETDIGQRALAWGSISVEGWQQSWYGNRHALIYLSHIQHWIIKNKFNFPHRHQTYGYEWSFSVEGSASEMPTNLSSLNVDIFQTTINSWAEVTSWGSREAWYRVIRVLPRMGKIDVITYKYVIKRNKQAISLLMVSSSLTDQSIWTTFLNVYIHTFLFGSNMKFDGAIISIYFKKNSNTVLHAFAVNRSSPLFLYLCDIVLSSWICMIY